MVRDTDRAERMKRLRIEKYWTLQMIADYEGITRERVRQVIGNTGHGYKAKLHQEIRKAETQ